MNTTTIAVDVAKSVFEVAVSIHPGQVRERHRLSREAFGRFLGAHPPVGRMTAVVGLQPFIGLTFIFFALFPLSLALAPDGYGLIVAFVVWGLREIGEPARKALIVSLLPAPIRAQGVGLYWGIRGIAICWASLIGALVWFWLGPQALLYLAFAFGCAGAAVFYLYAREVGTGVDVAAVKIESRID